MPKQQFIQNQVLYKVENRRSTSLFSIASPKQKKGKKKEDVDWKNIQKIIILYFIFTAWLSTRIFL